MNILRKLIGIFKRKNMDKITIMDIDSIELLRKIGKYGGGYKFFIHFTINGISSNKYVQVHYDIPYKRMDESEYYQMYLDTYDIFNILGYSFPVLLDVKIDENLFIFLSTSSSVISRYSSDNPDFISNYMDSKKRFKANLDGLLINDTKKHVKIHINVEGKQKPNLSEFLNECKNKEDN